MSKKLFIIIWISSLPFLFTLNGEFVFDDSEAVVKNEDVTSEMWTTAFRNDFWGVDVKSNLSHKSYRPLTVLSFRLNYLLNKRNLCAFHFKFTNLICHIISCLLLWNVLESIVFNKRKQHHETRKNKKSMSKHTNDLKWWMDIPYLSTLLFAVHPIHVEAVSGVVGRADLLAAITFFLALLCYNRAVDNHNSSYIYLICTIVLAGISMLCKENGITVLGFCLVYEFTTKLTPVKKVSTNLKKLNISKLEIFGIDSIIRILVLMLAALVLLYGRWIVMGGAKPEFKPTDNPTAFANNLFTKAATYSYIYYLNGLLLIWPKWLCYDWSMGCIQLIEKITDIRIILVLLMYFYAISLLYVLVKGRSRRTKSIIILAISLIIIPFLPAANIFYPVGFVIAERVLYISSAGYCLLIVMGFNKLMYRKSLLMCKFGVLMFLMLLLLYSLRSWQRSKEWQNEYKLFVSALPVCSLNAKVHYNVAKAADANNQTTWAIKEYEEAIRLYPEYYQAMNNLANILKNQKQFEDAEYLLETAVKYKRDFPAAWMNLGIVLAHTGRFSESETAYKTAISYRKKYPDCYFNLGNLYLELNKTEDALNSFLQAINEDPKHVLAWTNLMALMDNTDQIERALKIIPRALTNVPDVPSINFAIANIYGKLNRYSEAESYFNKVIKLLGTEVQAIHYANLGVLYHRWKKYNLAKEMYMHALEIDPSYKTARTNLENLRKLIK